MEVRGVIVATAKTGRFGDYLEVKLKDKKFNVSREKKSGELVEAYQQVLDLNHKAVIAQVSNVTE